MWVYTRICICFIHIETLENTCYVYFTDEETEGLKELE